MRDGQARRGSPRRGRGRGKRRGGGGDWEDKFGEIAEKSGLKCKRARNPRPGRGVATGEEGSPTGAPAMGATRREAEPLAGEEGEQETTGAETGKGKDEKK